MDIQIETITPRKASQFLKANDKNRKLRRATIESYARDMENGKWLMSGDPIRFNGDGTLIDGQHRLHACIESDTPFKAVIIRGLKTDIRTVIDSGAHRNFANVMQIAGIKNAFFAASTTTSLLRLKHHQEYIRRMSHSELMGLYRKHKRGIDETVELINANRPYKFPYGLIGALYYITAEKLDDPENANAMLDVFVDGEKFFDGDPLHRLREEIIKLRLKGVRPGSDATLWTYVSCLNAFRAEMPIDKITWQKEPIAIEGLNYNKL